jgi:hypothetical protein
MILDWFADLSVRWWPLWCIAIVGMFAYAASWQIWPDLQKFALYRLTGLALQWLLFAVPLLACLALWCVNLLAFALPGRLPSWARMSHGQIIAGFVWVAAAAALSVAEALYRRLRPARQQQDHPRSTSQRS